MFLSSRSRLSALTPNHHYYLLHHAAYCTALGNLRDKPEILLLLSSILILSFLKGDSGGPVFSYLNNNNQESSTPSFIGLSLQIALYVDSKNTNKKFIYGENVNLRDEEMEKCRTANELSVLKKECILGWLEYLVYNESNFRRKEILKEIFDSFIWK
ncbi:unnamed protein product [Meloidogyne enterolobii]|uniref:Uncharacterized protein n=2 Tax=Meloidogyne enterolobii TaxID=390850 RepID=A0ACB0ZW42_MELEN